jgi:hypothetical protein
MLSRKKVFLVGALLLILSLLVPAALGASVHLKGGKNAKPTFADNGLTLNAMGALSGLGNEDVLITLNAMADVTAVCTVPSGANEAPGQNPAPISVTGSQAIPAPEVDNGNTPFNVTTVAPPSEIAGAPDCPNGNWTETITDLAFTSATLIVEQPAGTVVLTVTCTFSQPTSDGIVPKQQVSCSSS